MRPILCSLILVLWSAMAFAAEECTSTTSLDWEYAPHANLGYFRIYLSPTSGSYKFGEAFVPGGYYATAPSMEELVTSLSCNSLYLQPGKYFAVVTAVSLDSRVESGPSNEIIITKAGPSIAPPPPTDPLPPPPPGPVILPKPPPPLLSTVPKITLPPSTGGNGDVLTTCQWQGNCR